MKRTLNLDYVYDLLISDNLLSEDALMLIIGINGNNYDTYNDVVYYLTGYTLDSYIEMLEDEQA